MPEWTRRDTIELLIHLPFMICGIAAGGHFGFQIGGVGGAIVFGFVGVIVGFITPRLVLGAAALLLFVAVMALIIGAIVFVIWGIYKLWGVRP